ncbi:MAG: RNA 2',3'-cyclic phosphodiesterase [Rhodocyclaceae bacterium]|nr:RNA 2',3'-cyclic phosphodiesterase [Rhodocyclaceae bacterium]MBX3670292.1 RNA 2',3'-cyclic phosphodiesterase [Rhodocyclaceae bacterium]
MSRHASTLGKQPGGSDDTLRVYFALWPPAAVAQALAAWQRVLHATLGGRMLRADRLHLTLAFIGEIPAARLPALLDIGAQIRGRRSCLHLNEAGAWRHNRIAWAGTRTVPAELARLAGDLGASLGAGGFAVERRPFVPHVTLLRNVERCAPVPGGLADIDWPLSELCLLRSRLEAQGARYERLAAWPLD